jgi:hypothetical protein
LKATIAPSFAMGRLEQEKLSQWKVLHSKLTNHQQIKLEQIGKPITKQVGFFPFISDITGIITRSVVDIFHRLKKTGLEYSIKVSHLELYNEELIDLLNLENKSLKLFGDSNLDSSVTVHGLTEVTVYTQQEVFNIVAKSSQMRRTAETNLNHQSRYSFR